MSIDRLIVCGGRTFNDRARVWAALWELDPGIIFEGGAKGADRLAAQWADFYRKKRARCEAEWQKFGPSAGPRRNRKMLSLKPVAVLAFPGGVGTGDMRAQAYKAGVEIIQR